MKIPKSQSKTAEPCKLTAEMSQADASVFQVQPLMKTPSFFLRPHPPHSVPHDGKIAAQANPCGD